MNRFRSFMRDKGFYLALLACILAAAVSSFWAIRSMVRRLDGEAKPPQGLKEEIPWEAPQVQAEQKTHNVPVQPTPSAVPQQPASQSSGRPAPQPQPSALPDAAGPAAVSFVQPVSGQITAGYSGDELVYSRTLGDWRTHNGVDIACAADAAVKACRAGRVTAVYDSGNWGRVVEVESDGMIYRYSGLAPEVTVKAEDAVAAGQQLGVIGEVPCEVAEGPHLHFEVLQGGVCRNPVDYLQ